jgi:hypothetical protein
VRSTPASPSEASRASQLHLYPPPYPLNT